MTGKVKAGEGTLVGNAGEHYVMAELLKRSAIAALAPRNAPSFDIIATKGDKTVRVRVKTKSEQYDIWQWVIKKDGSIFRNISPTGDFTVLVNLTTLTKDLAFYVIPTAALDKTLKQNHDEWVRTPGKNGRPHDPSNKQRTLSYKKYSTWLAGFLHQWDLLWK